MIDSVIQFLISTSVCLLFLIAGLHKLANRSEFQGIIENYKLIPPKFSKTIVLILGLTELTLAAGWLFSQSSAIPIVSICLLSIYTLSITINLVRGRVYIDCGCGFSKFDRLINRTNGSHLSLGLVIRNLGLMVIMMGSLLPSNSRILNYLDYMNLLFSLICIVAIYAAANQLLRNNNAISSWRKLSE